MTIQTHEIPYFPAPEVTVRDDGSRFEVYRRDKTEVRLVRLPPDGVLTSLCPQQARVGMIVSGELSATAGGVTKAMKAEADVYVVPPGAELSIVNRSPAEAVLLEIRRDRSQDDGPAPDTYFLEPIESRKFVGMDVTFFLADWIELMIANIPGGGEMPYHSHHHEQIGTCLAGRYDMTVVETSHELRFGATYFCASHEGHGAANPHAEEARSLNIFIPPRYHRVPKQEAERESR
ncbi:cupin domain-containing protein [Actinomadura rudentiformis]|uniref:Cupin domain-containing protein n=1 Tax=Actinomadura rudentiformis TaxID=359158 RepID=A0A6H9YKU6_9ACTN|nr:cupin domain-containing protein [Actinomadura rudentiformis]KAB2345165.1 cupin domain-containing protein [Actinomadura rudentiformis]